jgi:AcrR family transcriptional regulator
VKSGSRKVERGLETRREIIAAATRLFAEHGYAKVSIEAVLAACQISRGALYHHFPSKEVLLEAAYEAVEGHIARHVANQPAAPADAAGALQAGCDAFLDLTRDRTVRQIALIDAPAVLGWDKWREIDKRHAFGLLKAALAPAAADAGLPEALVDPFAHMLLASLLEIALLIAQSDDPEKAISTGKAAIREFLARLLARR